jgi:CBS domain-containing protein
MLEHELNAVAVVDAAGRILGILDATTIARLYLASAADCAS